MIYVLSPYTHPSPDVRRRRAHQAATFAAWLNASGRLAYSPVAHGHFLWEAARLSDIELGEDYAHWQRHSRFMLRRCDAGAVLCLPGWLESAGVTDERELCAAASIPLTYWMPRRQRGTSPYLEIVNAE